MLLRVRNKTIQIYTAGIDTIIVVKFSFSALPNNSDFVVKSVCLVWFAMYLYLEVLIRILAGGIVQGRLPPSLHH
jgi:hypothetical protein